MGGNLLGFFQVRIVKNNMMLVALINPLVPNAPFFHLYGFLMFSGGRERIHWERMGFRKLNQLY